MPPPPPHPPPCSSSGSSGGDVQGSRMLLYSGSAWLQRRGSLVCTAGVTAMGLPFGSETGLRCRFLFVVLRRHCFTYSTAGAILFLVCFVSPHQHCKGFSWCAPVRAYPAERSAGGGPWAVKTPCPLSLLCPPQQASGGKVSGAPPGRMQLIRKLSAFLLPSSRSLAASRGEQGAPKAVSGQGSLMS